LSLALRDSDATQGVSSLGSEEKGEIFQALGSFRILDLLVEFMM